MGILGAIHFVKGEYVGMLHILLAFPAEGKGDRAAVEGVVRRTIPNCGVQVSTSGSPSGRAVSI